MNSRHLAEQQGRRRQQGRICSSSGSDQVQDKPHDRRNHVIDDGFMPGVIDPVGFALNTGGREVVTQLREFGLLDSQVAEWLSEPSGDLGGITPLLHLRFERDPDQLRQAATAHLGAICR